MDITAVVIIKAPDERAEHRDLSHANLGDYLPELENIIQAARYLRDAGFSVKPYMNHLKISGSASLFEAFFNVSLLINTDVICIGNIRVPGPLENVFVRVIFSTPMLAEAS